MGLSGPRIMRLDLIVFAVTTAHRVRSETGGVDLAYCRLSYIHKGVTTRSSDSCSGPSSQRSIEQFQVGQRTAPHLKLLNTAILPGLSTSLNSAFTPDIPHNLLLLCRAHPHPFFFPLRYSYTEDEVVADDRAGIADRVGDGH